MLFSLLGRLRPCCEPQDRLSLRFAFRDDGADLLLGRLRDTFAARSGIIGNDGNV